jgi:hypothetical protein
MSHTQGKLEVLDGRRISVTLPSLIEGCGYSSHCVALTYGDDERVNSLANARRLVTCWNALIDLPQDTLDGGWTRAGLEAYGLQMKAEADSLRAVNAELLEALEVAKGHIGMASLEVSHCKDAAQIRAAIASARKQKGEA